MSKIKQTKIQLFWIKKFFIYSNLHVSDSFAWIYFTSWKNSPCLYGHKQ